MSTSIVLKKRSRLTRTTGRRPRVEPVSETEHLEIWFFGN